MMFRTVFLLGSLACATVAGAQPVRNEVTRATTPGEDARPNSDAVPEGLAISTQFERIAILRFKHEADLLPGIERLLAQQGIVNAVVLSGVGSVRNYQIHTVSNRTFPSKNMFIKDASTPADIVGMNGYILNGRPHIHVTLADDEKSFGGHLEPETNVFTFAIVTLGVLPASLDLNRLDDKTYR